MCDSGISRDARSWPCQYAAVLWRLSDCRGPLCMRAVPVLFAGKELLLSLPLPAFSQSHRLSLCLCGRTHSLWEVPSASTVALMLTFYHLLLSGDRGFLEWPQRSPSILVKDAREDLPPAGVKMDAAEALVRAQQWLRCANMEDVCCLLPDRGPTAACLRRRGWVPNPANSNVHGRAKSRAGGLAGNMAAGSRTHAHKKPFASPFYWAGFIVVGDG